MKKIIRVLFIPEITNSKQNMQDDLKSCVEFHGHICPGLIYGYRVAREAMKLMNIRRSVDEEVVAICGEMTMATKMMKLNDGRQVCIPCSEKR